MFKRFMLTGPLVFTLAFALALAIPAHADTITYTATFLDRTKFLQPEVWEPGSASSPLTAT
jgi:hypothetical protein